MPARYSKLPDPSSSRPEPDSAPVPGSDIPFSSTRSASHPHTHPNSRQHDESHIVFESYELRTLETEAEHTSAPLLGSSQNPHPSLSRPSRPSRFSLGPLISSLPQILRPRAHAQSHATTPVPVGPRQTRARPVFFPRLRVRPLCLLVTLCFLALPILSTALVLVAYIRPAAVGAGSRLCVPFSLHRIHQGAHNRLACSPTSTSTLASTTTFTSTTTLTHTPTDTFTDKMSDADASSATHGDAAKGGFPNLGRLAGWLQAQKDAFVADLRKGDGKGWVVAMGNDAGDLDTIASSIAYAHLSSVLFAERMVPLILTPSGMMSVRPENLLALKNASVPLSVLLHPESLPVPTADLAGLGVRFALVDHNKLLPQFGPIVPGVVQGVIDHHDDEHEHTDAAVRVIQVPTGSCSSLVATHFMPQWQAALSGPAGDAGSPVPNEVATLLLSAGLIDTHGLKAHGKAVEADYAAGAFLYPLSPWYTAAGTAQAVSETFIPGALHEQAKELNEIKHNVSFLSTSDLLLRDYKSYVLPTSSSAYPVLRVGLSTVPLGLKAWLEKEGGGWQTFLPSVDQFMLEQNVDVEGILTTFKSKGGKKKREILLIVRHGANGVLDEEAARRAVEHIAKGMEADVTLSLIPWEKKGWKRFLNRKKRQGLDGKLRFGRVWEQANAEATRKVVAPLVRKLVAELK